MDKRDKIYRIVSQILAGKVMTYGQIGRIIGINPRLVGRILHQNPDPENIPCHRVVNFRGELAENFAFGGAGGQRKKLESEGVHCIKRKINLKKYLLESIEIDYKAKKVYNEARTSEKDSVSD